MKIYTLKWTYRLNRVVLSCEVKGDATSIITVVGSFDRGLRRVIEYTIFDGKKPVDIKKFKAEDLKNYEKTKLLQSV